MPARKVVCNKCGRMLSARYAISDGFNRYCYRCIRADRPKAAKPVIPLKRKRNSHRIRTRQKDLKEGAQSSNAGRRICQMCRTYTKSRFPSQDGVFMLCKKCLDEERQKQRIRELMK